MAEPDWKRPPRIKAPAAIRAKVRRDPTCRNLECGQPGTDGHHVLYRSRGGDDVEDNIVALCHPCHMNIHTDHRGTQIRAAVGTALRPEEIQYVTGKLGDEPGRWYLKRHYDVSEGDARFHAPVPHRRRAPKGVANLHAISDL